MNFKRIFLTFVLCMTCLSCERSTPEPLEADVVIYGATPGGIAAGIAARRQNKSVIIVEPTNHVGGMSSSGLSASDYCDERVIGGISYSFFVEIGRQYKRPILWVFEPHVAERVFEKFIRDNEIKLVRNERLQSAQLESRVLRSITTQLRTKILGKVFIDASYEGDLIAAAGIPYFIGRESREAYGETLAGVTEYMENRQFHIDVPALDKDGKRYTYVSDKPRAPLGSGDKKIMAYNYRPCVTTVPENRVPIEKPANYKASDYELLLAFLQRRPHTLLKEMFWFFRLPNKKFDLNNKRGFSTDFIGQNWDYPEASEKERERIRQEHKAYTLGLFYFLANDPRVPPLLRQNASRMGLCKDEFVDNDHWPYQLYVRQARRMHGVYVMREQDLLHDVRKADSVGVAACPIESHHVDIHMDDAGLAKFEGYANKRVLPYEIPYRSLTPKKAHATNVLNPVTLSSSHIAYSSVRMEPTYMILGESAGTAAAIAIDKNIPVQDVPYDLLAKILTERGQKLQAPGPKK